MEGTNDELMEVLILIMENKPLFSQWATEQGIFYIASFFVKHDLLRYKIQIAENMSSKTADKIRKSLITSKSRLLASKEIDKIIDDSALLHVPLNCFITVIIEALWSMILKSLEDSIINGKAWKYFRSFFLGDFKADILQVLNNKEHAKYLCLFLRESAGTYENAIARLACIHCWWRVTNMLFGYESIRAEALNGLNSRVSSSSDQDIDCDNSLQPLQRMFALLFECGRALQLIISQGKFEVEGTEISPEHYKNNSNSSPYDFDGLVLSPTLSTRTELQYCLKSFEFVEDFDSDVENLDPTFLRNSVVVLDRIIRMVERETFTALQKLFPLFINSDFYVRMVAAYRCGLSQSVGAHRTSDSFLRDVSIEMVGNTNKI